MRWLKDIFHRKAPSVGSERFTLADLESWLEEMSSDPEAENRLKDIYAQMEEVAGDLAEDVRALNSAIPDEATHPRLLKAGLAARGAVANQINALYEKLMLSAGFDAAEYSSGLIKALGRTVTMFGRSQRFVAALFPKEAERINSELGRLSRLLVELDDEIGKRNEAFGGVKESKELLQRFREERTKIDELKRSIGGREEALRRLQDSAGHLREELEILESSDEGREAQNLRSELSERRAELNLIEAEMADLIAPLNKALARIVKQESIDRLSLEYSEAFELLSRSPAKALDSDISRPLLELKSKIDLLGIKDKKREKIIEQIDCLIREKPLATLKAKHSEIQKQINNLEDMFEKNSMETFSLDEEWKRMNDQISGLFADIALEKGHLTALEKRAAGDKAELLAKIERLAGRPVEIDL